MPKFTVRAHKTVYSPVNVEVEANTFIDAVRFGLAKLHVDYPNWTDKVDDLNIINVEVWVKNDPSRKRKKRTFAVGGRDRDRLMIF
jgi:hypothetical protein